MLSTNRSKANRDTGVNIAPVSSQAKTAVPIPIHLSLLLCSSFWRQKPFSAKLYCHRLKKARLEPLA